MKDPDNAEQMRVGKSPHPFDATRKYAIKAEAVMVAPYEKFENFRMLNTKAKPIAMRAYTVPVEIPLINV